MLFESAKKSRRHAVIEASLSLDDEILLFDFFDRKGYEFVTVKEYKYYFRRKGLI